MNQDINKQTFHEVRGCSRFVCGNMARLQPRETKNQQYRSDQLRYFIKRKWRVEVYTWSAWKYSWSSTATLNYPADTDTDKTIVQLGTLTTDQTHVLGAIRVKIRELVPSSPDFKCTIGPNSSFGSMDDLDYLAICTFHAHRATSEEDWVPGNWFANEQAGMIMTGVDNNLNLDILKRTHEDWLEYWARDAQGTDFMNRAQSGQQTLEDEKEDVLGYFLQKWNDTGAGDDRFANSFINSILILCPWYTTPSDLASQWQNQPYTNSSETGVVVGAPGNPAPLTNTWKLAGTDVWQKVGHTIPTVRMYWDGRSQPLLTGPCCCDEITDPGGQNIDTHLQDL